MRIGLFAAPRSRRRHTCRGRFSWRRVFTYSYTHMRRARVIIDPPRYSTSNRHTPGWRLTDYRWRINPISSPWTSSVIILWKCRPSVRVAIVVAIQNSSSDTANPRRWQWQPHLFRSIQAAPKKWVHRLMTIILSFNLKWLRKKIFTGRFLGKFCS